VRRDIEARSVARVIHSGRVSCSGRAGCDCGGSDAEARPGVGQATRITSSRGAVWVKLTRFGGAAHTFTGGFPHGQNPPALLA
jgi:hypothetical protein